jgi:hypothetical protein
MTEDHYRAEAQRRTKISGDPLTALLDDPKNIDAAIEQERLGKAPLGWLGVAVLARANWQMSLALGDGFRQVEVHLKSSAYRHAGLRTGDFLKPVKVNGAAGVPVEEFDSLALPCGTKVILEYYRHGTGRASGWLIGEATLTRPPRVPAVPEWKQLPQVACGRRVQKKDRSKFIATISKPSQRRDFTPAMVRAVTVLALRFDNDEHEGFWPSYATMAREFGCSRRHAVTLIARLRWAGVIKVVEGPTAQRPSNLHQLTWPGRGQVALPRRTYRV